MLIHGKKHDILFRTNPKNAERYFYAMYIIMYLIFALLDTLATKYFEDIETNHFGFLASAPDRRIKWGRNDLSVWLTGRCEALYYSVGGSPAYNDKNWPKFAPHLPGNSLDSIYQGFCIHNSPRPPFENARYIFYRSKTFSRMSK